MYENALHLDLFGIEDICTIEELPYVILHEMHHLQIQKLLGDYSGFTERFTLLDDYIFRFTGGGPGCQILHPLLNRHFEEHFSLFDETVQKIRQIPS